MTTITDNRGWLSRQRGLRNKGPVTTEEQMAQLKKELDAELDRDPEKRFRRAQGAMSEEGKAALERGRKSPILKHVARLLGVSDG